MPSASHTALFEHVSVMRCFFAVFTVKSYPCVNRPKHLAIMDPRCLAALSIEPFGVELAFN